MLSKRGSVGYRMKDSPCARSALLRIAIVRPSVSYSSSIQSRGRHGNVEIGTAAICLVLCCVVTLAKQKAVSPAPWSQWWPQNPSQHAHVARHLTWFVDCAGSDFTGHNLTQQRACGSAVGDAMPTVYRLHSRHHISNRLKQHAAHRKRRQLWLPYNPSCTWRGIAVMLLKQESRERSRHSG